MKLSRRILAMVIVVCFVFSDVSFALESNSFKLAVPDSFAGAKKEEFRETAAVQVGVHTALKEIRDFNADTLRALGPKDFNEQSVFGNRVSGTAHFEMAEECELSGIKQVNYIIKVAMSGNERYCLIVKAQAGEDHIVLVMSGNELAGAIKGGTVKFVRENNPISDGLKNNDASGKAAQNKKDLFRNAMSLSLIASMCAFGASCVTPEYSINFEKDGIRIVDEAAYKRQAEQALKDHDALSEKILGDIGSMSDQNNILSISRLRISVQAHIRNLKDESTRHYAISVLRVSDMVLRDAEAALPVLRELAKSDPDNSVRTRAAELVKSVEYFIEAHKAPQARMEKKIDADTIRKWIVGVSNSEGNKNYLMLPHLDSLNQYLVDSGETVKPYLVKLLDDKDYFVRSIACLVLGEIGDKSATPFIIKKLENMDEHIYVRLAALYSLALMRDKQAMPVLINALHEKDRFILSHVVEIVGEMGSEARYAIPILERISEEKDKNDSVNDEAREALRKIKKAIGKEEQKKEESPKEEPKKGAMLNAPAEISGAGVEPAAKLSAQQSAVSDLRETISRSRNQDTDTCRRANAELGKTRDKLAVDALIENLRAEYWQAPDAAARALANTKEPRVIDALISALEYSSRGYWFSGSLHSGVCWALGELGDNRAVEPLIKELLSEDKDDAGGCVAAAMALAKLGDDRAVEPLRKALSDQNEQVQAAAKEAIAKIGKAAAFPKNASEALVKFGDTKTAEPLIKALADTNWTVRAAAAEALGNIGDTKAVEALIKALEDTWAVRAAAAEALGKIGDRRAVKPLIETDFSIHSYAAKALVRIGTPAVEPIVLALGNTSVFVRSAKGTDYFRSSAAADAILEIGAPAVEPLIKELGVTMMGRNTLYTRSETATEYLAMIGAPAVGPLIKVLEDKRTKSDVCEAVARALGKIGDKSALPRLKEVAEKDESENVRRAAKEAVEKIEKAAEREKGKKDKEPKKGAMLNAPAAPQDIKAAKARMGTAIPHLNDMQYGQMWRVEDITEILWKEETGAISKDEAKAELAKLAPEAGATVAEREAAYSDWMSNAGLIMLGLALKRPANEKPSDDEIRAIAATVKAMGIEVFVPASQLPNGTQPQFRRILDTVFGDRLKVYQRIDDLSGMIKNPEKTIVMTVDLTDNDIASLEKIKADLSKVRFMNFENIDLKKASQVELENYLAETLSILLVARAITAEDSKDKASPTYRMLSHLLEGRMADAKEIDGYIAAMTDMSVDPISKLRYLLKAILKAVPVAVYKLMKPAVEVLWSA